MEPEGSLQSFGQYSYPYMPLQGYVVPQGCPYYPLTGDSIPWHMGKMKRCSWQWGHCLL